MNKNIFYLIAILIVLVTIINIKTYINTKKEFFNETNRALKIKEKAKNIIKLKQKLKNKTYLLNKICKIKDSKYICENLDKKKFNRLNTALKQLNIKKLKIQKQKQVTVILEIE